MWEALGRKTPAAATPISSPDRADRAPHTYKNHDPRVLRIPRVAVLKADQEKCVYMHIHLLQ